jgi:hypothetical protein
MPELNSEFPRDWVEFQNPANPEEIFKCDLTWLTSFWSCIYGNGCQGIDSYAPDAGCCSDGAYYSDKNDENRVTKTAARLTPDIWQHYESARNGKKLSITEIGLDKDRKTRKINNSCIFLNRSDFPGPKGCALHHLALRENVHFVETKPDVCWQLPIRRSFETREVGDNELSVTVIGEYERVAWGEGGADFDWYCTNNTDAHHGKEPVYISNKSELVALMGEAAYSILAEICDRRMLAVSETERISRKRSLPLLNIHPATVRAAR